MDKKTFFNQAAQSWDERFRTPELQERLRQIVSMFNLSPASRVLDLGGRAGGIIPYLLRAIGPDGKMLSVDFADQMVEIGMTL